MFCMNCGTQLPEGAKFCFKCGTDMNQFFAGDSKEKGDTSLKAETIQDTPRKETVTLNIGNWKVEYPESIKTYIESYSFYADLAGNESRKFEQYYKNAGINCLEDVLDKGASIFATQIQAILEISFNRLLKFGVDTLTPSMYWDIIFTYNNPDEVFQPFQKSADAIIEFASRLANMRDAERMMRGKWVGGGFGIKGAIKGAIKAGVMNMGTNALRGIGDTITNASDKAKLNKIRAAAFPTDTSKQLSNGIFDFVLAIHDAEMSVLVQNGLVVKITFDATKEKIQLTNRIHSVSGENLESLYQAAVAALHADPFDLDVYKEIYSVARVASKLSSEDTNMVHDLFAFAEFFGVLKYCQKIFTEIDVKALKNTLERLASHPDTMEQNFSEYTTMLQALKEQNPYLDAGQALSMGEDYRDKIVSAYKQVNQELEQEQNFKAHYAELVSMIKSGDISTIWSLSKKQDALAQYVLTEYYRKEVLGDAIDKGDIREFDAVIRSILETNSSSDIFTQFLINDLSYSMYILDRRSDYKVNVALDAIERLSNTSDCISVMAFAGYFLTAGNKEYNEEGIKKLKYAAEKLHPLAMAWYGSYLLEGSHGIKADKRLAIYYLGMAVYANQGYALKLNDKYSLDLITYQADLESRETDSTQYIYDEQQYFVQTNNGTILMQIPKPLVEKYKDRFKTSPKDIIMFGGIELETTKDLLYARKAFQIPPQEKVYFAMAANLFGHFKENMQGLAIGSNGIYTNGGAFSFKGLMSWEKFGKAKIYVQNGLKIGNITVITPLEKMLEAFFKDLHKIYEADMNPNTVRKITRTEAQSPQVDLNTSKLGLPQPKEASPVREKNVSTVSDGVICPSCKKINKAGKRFCTQCGASLGLDQLCKQCGAKLRPGKKFCSGCGAKIV